MKNTIFRLGELFCGPGGIACAAVGASSKSATEKFSVAHAWATDYDEDTCNTYRRNICPDEPDTVVCADIRKLDLARLAKISEIDALAFGFPCNDFSMVGEQKGIDGVYGPLYSYGVKTLKKFKPKWFLAENVSGLRNSNDGEAFKTVLSELSGAGYVLTPHHYKFEEYGVPQARHRIIIIGIRNDLDVQFRVPKPLPGLQSIGAKQAIEVPPIGTNVTNNERTAQASQVVERLKFIKPGQNAFNATIPKKLQLNVRGAKISQIYRRLHPDKPAYTITGSGGGGTHVYHWAENRALTNRERARLQTFPDEFVFEGSKESVRKQIGMAVPPRGVKVIVKAVLDSFAGVRYEGLEPNIEMATKAKR